MNDLFKAWTQGMAAHQQGLNAWFPKTPGTISEPSEAAGTPLEAQFNELKDTWKASIEKWAALAKDTTQASTALSPATLREMFDPSRWHTASPDVALAQFLDGPRYATLGGLDRKVLELQQLASQRDQAVVLYQTIVQKAWQKATERFSSGAAGHTATAPSTWRELTDRWLTVANDTLVETYRTDEFVQAQRQMLRLVSDHRLKEQEIAEAWCKACHIPTRSELDETQRQVVELRRQLRALQRERRTRDHGPITPAARKRSTPRRQAGGTTSPNA